MMRLLFLLILTIVSMQIVPRADAQTTATPPEAKIEPTTLETHGDVRTDDYFWLRDRENPEVIAYLEAENAYTEVMTAHFKDLSDALFEEMKGRIKEDDSSVPYRKGDYWYYTRFETGKEYPIYARRKGSMEADEELMLDVNALAEELGTAFLQVSGVRVSPDAKYMAFAADTMGRRIYTVHFKNLETDAFFPETIDNVTPNFEWANDNRTVFYTKQDPGTLRWYQIYRHTVGTDPAGDVLVFEEADEEYLSFVQRTKSDEYLLIGSSQTVSNEYHFLDADDPTGAFTVILPRQRGLEYSVDHYGDHFYIHTNADGATNFKLMRTPVAAPSMDAWEEVIPHREDVLLSGFEIFKDYLVLVERSEALTHMQVRPWQGGEAYYLDFGEPAYLAYLSTNVEFDTPVLRFGYTSMTTPTTYYDFHMGTHEKTLLKETEVLGGFDKRNYVTERLWAEARDGTRVPISLVYHKDTPIDGTAPLLLYGYGSYGNSIDASFSSTSLSLVDRGFIYAIAHIRGGQEMGRPWYEDGKLMNKKNTFTDFIDCAEYLVEAGYADPERLFARGGSAGGLLMGAVINMRPDLWKGVVAAVPFVDIVTTMLDDTIPLTTFEYDEWGNPNEKDAYEYMLSYSPYDNVEAKEYPNLLVTTGLHDSQVQYWEPAKWVARMRKLKTDDNRLLLKTNMVAGHGGASGRFERIKEIAFEYAFVLDLAGATSVTPSTN